MSQSKIRKVLEAVIPSPVYEKVTGRKRLQEVFFNVNWLVFEKVFSIAVGVMVGAWVARYLGSENYGKLAYATSFVSLFICLSTLGLDQLLVRDIVNYPDKKNELLGTAFSLKLFGSLVLNALVSVLIFFLRPESPSLRVYVMIIAIGYIFKPFDVICYWFQSQVQSKYAVLSRIAALTIISVAKVVLVLQNAPLIAFAWMLAINSLLTAIGFLAFYHKFDGSIFKWRVKPGRIRALLRDSWPLIISAAAVSIHMQIGGLMLGNMLDDRALGIYAAAKRLMQWSLIATVVSNSIMPVLVDTKKRNEELYYQRLQSLYDIMIWLAIGISLIVTFISDFIINLLYGPDYAQSAVVLSILSWTAAFNFFSIVTSRYLIAENLTAIQLYRTFIGTGLNIVLNMLLIPRYGIIGTSVATLLSVVVQSYASLLFFRKTRRVFFMFFKSLNLYRMVKGIVGGTV